MEEYDLTHYRSKIAQLDDEILDLLIKRFELTDEVGKIKKENNIPVENKQVEEKVLSRFTEKIGDKPSKDSILGIYAEIFTHSKDRQRRI